MSKTNFTPGPWGACKIKHYHPQLIGETCCVKIGENIIEIDYIGIGHENKDYQQSEANAALIAAAPEMYEFIRWIRSVQGQCAIMKCRKFLPEILDKADEILQKARGGGRSELL